MRPLLRFVVTAIAAASVASIPTGAQVRYIDGLWLRTAEGVRELIVYAEIRSGGRLRMAQGDLEDAPTVHEVQGILASQPNWKPAAVIVTTTSLFTDESAERRNLPVATRMRNVYAAEVRVRDLERRDRIDALLRSVRASYDAPGYAFLVMYTDGAGLRYYPFRLTPAER